MIEGAKEVLESLSKKHSVYIVTGNLRKYTDSIPQKLDWIEKHLGKEWLRKGNYNKG